jgi:phosphatidylserine/phosphatidylglycerophosphate/cardiolipin synthase-like enzyme
MLLAPVRVGGEDEVAETATPFFWRHTVATHSTNSKSSKGLHVKLWRGEGTVLIGMDVDEPEDDFVGFFIEVQSPGQKTFMPLRNRIAFSYDKAAGDTVNGNKNYSSEAAPFQKFRWQHFPYQPKDGTYAYRVTKRHMKADGTLYSGVSVTAQIDYQITSYAGFLELGFTRGFASSQAFVDRYEKDGKVPPVIPANSANGLEFKKMTGDIYQWMGYEAYRLLFDTLKEIQAPAYTVDFMAYDLDEPDVVASIVSMGKRVRALLDNTADHTKAGTGAAEAAQHILASAGAENVKQTHFQGLQHNKVLVVKKNGKPVKVLFGSTNFSFRGLYIQANNMVVLEAPEIVQLFSDYFDAAFADPAGYRNTPMAQQWHDFTTAGKPPISVCLSPHTDPSLSLDRIGSAINGAKSSVFFAIAFLYQSKSGAVREAVDALEDKPLFSYGISDHTTGLTVKKPDGSTALVDFEYLSKDAPEPFKAEWAGGSGIHEHNKFVVVDFNLPTAAVFTGSCNMSVSGEKNNGDNLVMIQDQRVATSFALQALSIFDHLEFRTVMQAKDAPTEIVLAKPTSLSGKPAWFAKSYVANSQAARDRMLFSR